MKPKKEKFDRRQIAPLVAVALCMGMLVTIGPKRSGATIFETAAEVFLMTFSVSAAGILVLLLTMWLARFSEKRRRKRLKNI